MDYLVYLVYRAFTVMIAALPLGVAYRIGQALGLLSYLLLWPYRRLAIANLTIAYGHRESPAGIRRLARQHFATLGANLLCAIKAQPFDGERVRKIVDVEGAEILRAAFDHGKGVVLVLSHIGNWELFAHVYQFFPDYKWGTIYQPLRNPHIEAHIRRMRGKVALFSRKNGFSAPTAFLRAGGGVGVLVDQHAGDGGVWAPFFGRLASTSTLAALLALRTEAVLVPMALHSAGPGRWRWVVSPPIPREEPDGKPLAPDALTAEINQVLERQIDAAPADWFWVHNRWKTPKPKFLLATYRRGVVLPHGMTEDGLKPFRILVRSPNWLGDAVMTIPALQAIGRGRPDARITVLAPEKLADLWRVVPGVADVLPIAKGAGVFGVATAVRRAGPFDASVLLPNSLRAGLEAWLAGVPRRAGFAGHRRRWLLNQVVSEPPDPFALGRREADPASPGPPERVHQSLRYAHLALEVGAGQPFSSEGPAPLASLPGATGNAARGGWLRLGLCAGAEYGSTKRWLPERFAETGRRVAAQRACDWVLFGTAKDAALGQTIAQVLEDRCENLIGRTTLAELITELRGCQALLTNDTGTMHLAAWLGVPVVAVFGSTDPVLTGPLGAPGRVRILRHQVECSPCFLRECPLDMRCMKAVSVEEAVDAVLALVDQK